MTGPKAARIRKIDTMHQAGAYTSLEAAGLAGCTLRQLQWWDENEVLKPSLGTIGHDRAYSLRDIEKLRHIVDMRRGGVSLLQIRLALKHRGWNKVRIVRRRIPVVMNGVLFIAVC